MCGIQARCCLCQCILPPRRRVFRCCFALNPEKIPPINTRQEGWLVWEYLYHLDCDEIRLRMRWSQGRVAPIGFSVNGSSRPGRSRCHFREVESADLSPRMPDDVFLPLVSAAVVYYCNFAVRGRGRIPKVKWDVELPRDQSASILKNRERVVNVRCHSSRFSGPEKERLQLYVGPVR